MNGLKLTNDTEYFNQLNIRCIFDAREALEKLIEHNTIPKKFSNYLDHLVFNQNIRTWAEGVFVHTELKGFFYGDGFIWDASGIKIYVSGGRKEILSLSIIEIAKGLL